MKNMICINCGLTSNKYEECYKCHRIRNGMNYYDFYILCARICTSFPVLKHKKKFLYDRPVAHPLCKNPKCASFEEKYKNLIDHKGSEVYISKEIYKKIIIKPCIYCGLQKAGGIDRLNSNIGYKIDNIAPCWAQCNYMKKNMNVKDFLDHVCRVYIEQKKKMFH